jgi:hypothetical protein
MTGSAKQSSSFARQDWIASSQVLLAMTIEKMAGISPGHLHFAKPHLRGGAVPGGGGGGLLPPFRSGSMLRMVTRRFCRSGPWVSTFKYCSP